MRAYRVTLHACHDTNEIDIDLTPSQAALLERIAKLTQQPADAFAGSCTPIMTIIDSKDIERSAP